MENKVISIDIRPGANTDVTENAGVMWEHNATVLKFVIDEAYSGDYRYYLEYRSLMGTKVRTDYLEPDKNNIITYAVPVSMSSLKGVECYFNIVDIDGDGNTVQVIKPVKFCLSFDFSPDTDNSLAKVNDFSVNYLLEAIRSGTFKGDKGETGEKGDKGDKGDKGEQGEVDSDYLDNNFANAVRVTAKGNPLTLNDVSPISHKLTVRADSGKRVYACGKNLIPFNDKKYNGKYEAGSTYEMNGVSLTINSDGSVRASGTATTAVVFPLYYSDSFKSGKQKIVLSGSPEGSSSSTYCLRVKTGDSAVMNFEDYGSGKVIDGVDLTGIRVYIIVFGGKSVDAVFYPQIEFGDAPTPYRCPTGCFSSTAASDGTVNGLESVDTEMSLFSDSEIECTYNRDVNKAIAETELKNQQNMENLKYRLINQITCENDVQNVEFKTDLQGNALKNLNLGKIFILFDGYFVNTNTQTLIANFNGGSIYQMYKSFSVTADKYYGFWLESERIIALPDKAVFKSIYPSAMLSNFTESSSFAQGLVNNNVAANCDISVMPNCVIESVRFGCGNTNNSIKAGSHIYIFGA